MQNPLCPKFPLYFWPNPFVKSMGLGQGEGSYQQFYFWYPWVPTAQWNTKTCWCILISNFLFFWDGLMFTQTTVLKPYLSDILVTFTGCAHYQGRHFLYLVWVAIWPFGYAERINSEVRKLGGDTVTRTTTGERWSKALSSYIWNGI